MTTASSGYFELPLSAAAPRLEIEEDGTIITRTVRPGGMRVITQEVPTSRSVVLGFWVPAGSRDEGADHLGSTHYLEHLLFKGSKSRTAIQIAKEFDAVGGDFNAATAKESTHYYCRVLAKDLPMAVDVMMEMLAEPTLDKDAFDLEQTVILGELAMAKDDPSDVAFEEFSAQMFGKHPLGMPVGGTAETVTATPLEAVKAHHDRWYQPKYVVVAAAGGITHKQLNELLDQSIAKTSWQVAQGVDPMEAERYEAPVLRPDPVVLTKDVEQAQVLWGTRSSGARSERRDVMSMLLTFLSGGMSSLLFQEIREKRGLAYSTFAFDSVYTDTGQFGMYAGCAPDNVTLVRDLLVEQLETIAQGSLTDEDRKLALGQLYGGVALGSESNRARMVRLGQAEVGPHQLRSFDEVFKSLDAVTNEDVARLAADLLDQPAVQVVVSSEKK